MENNNNNQETREWTLEELLGADIDDILGDTPPASKTAAELADEPVQPVEEQKPEQSAPMKNQPEKPQKESGNTFLTYVHDIAYLLAGLVLVFLLLFRVVIVSGTSMNNTLLDGDYLLVLSNTFYHDPQYGDIIVASKQSFDDGAPIVKRVIATEGQKVDIDFKAGIVYVDDVPLEENYTLTPTTMQEGIKFPLVVEEGCLFVMGDNRGGSKDSRHPDIGLIDEREVLGKVFFLFFPGTNHEQYERDFGRIGVVD